MVEDAAPTDLARGTLNRARDHLLGLQHADGWWQGELETNVTMDAEDLLLREFLGLHDDAVIAAAGRWIRSQQREDGTWANFYGGPARRPRMSDRHPLLPHLLAPLTIGAR